MCTQSYGVQQHVCGQWSMDGCKQEITWIASNIQLTVPIDGDEKNLSKFTDETRSKMFFFRRAAASLFAASRVLYIYHVYAGPCVRTALLCCAVVVVVALVRTKNRAGCTT